MKTFEEGERLIRQAEWILKREVWVALEDRKFNLVVRRAQETVELVLKGGVRIMGGDYPKVHDVAPVFCQMAGQRLEASSGEFDRILKISQQLSETRAPSFYIESEYSKKDANDAYNDARFVVGEVKKILGIT